jgi:hypothetical protein
MAFSTIDKDHDTDPQRNCAQMWKGAWWYYGCHEVRFLENMDIYKKYSLPQALTSYHNSHLYNLL